MAEFIKWGWAAVTVYIGVFNKALEYDNLVGVGFCEKFFKKKKKKKKPKKLTESAQAAHLLCKACLSSMNRIKHICNRYASKK